ncbi:hypothetical protein [Streptomyces formicae]|uniref:Integral membrane protein n=1 Tax=Streptomyces formicae TaxID=1616117 RepID=A0ABY3WME9_9ACTN|nr:hypothetical protein [Streptomyces formicae]UNM13787.1 hypothetical protein J4032_22080 [Streptomyces formicae]
MNTTIRRIAVSGSAAVALLGGAAAITTATADTASAAEIQTVVDKASGAPVTMPDGRTVHVRGLDSAAYRADASHRTAVVQLAAATDTQPGGITGMTQSLNGPAPQSGAGQQIQQPVYNPQQVQTQAGGGAIGVGVVVILVLAIIVIVRVKNGPLKAGDAVLSGLFGIALSGTVIGSMGSQITGSLVSSLGGVLGGL